jgi:riboflavin biosynthesis pyrimidine reductase
VLDPYLGVDRAPPDARPWVMANMVSGIDGSTAIDGRVGPLSTPPDAALFTRLRSLADVVLVGAATVRQERYGAVRLAPELQQRRVDEGRPALPPIAVVSRRLDFDWTTPLFTATAGPPPIILTCASADERAVAEAAEHADVVMAGDRAVDMACALDALHERGHRIVLCEGGATLLGELATNDLLDELCLTISPLMGGDAVPVARASAAPKPVGFRLAHVGRDGDALFLRYERSDGGS